MPRTSPFSLLLALGCSADPLDDAELVEQTWDPEIPCFNSEPPQVDIDCESIPSTPLSATELDAPRGFHDLAFDDQGRIIGADESYSFLAVSRDDTFSVHAAGLAESEQMDWLPDGDLAVATHEGIVRVSPEGGVSLISTETPFSLVTGPDGLLYTANDGVRRIDPETGAMTQLVPSMGEVAARIVNFSPDFRRLYLATITSTGDVYAVDLDPALNPIGPPWLFATGVGDGWHDTLGVDVCGNLYIADYDTTTLYRVTSTGEVSILVDFRETDRTKYGHGVEWGSGLGGWKADAIYLSQPIDDNTVLELDVAVPSRCAARP